MLEQRAKIRSVLSFLGNILNKSRVWSLQLVSFLVWLRTYQLPLICVCVCTHTHTHTHTRGGDETRVIAHSALGQVHNLSHIEFSRMGSRAPSFNFHYLAFFLRTSCSCLHNSLVFPSLLLFLLSFLFSVFYEKFSAQDVRNPVSLPLLLFYVGYSFPP